MRGLTGKDVKVVYTHCPFSVRTTRSTILFYGGQCGVVNSLDHPKAGCQRSCLSIY